MGAKSPVLLYLSVQGHVLFTPKPGSLAQVQESLVLFGNNGEGDVLYSSSENLETPGDACNTLAILRQTAQHSFSLPARSPL